MASNNREIEIKFRIQNPEEIRKKIMKSGKLIGKAFEKTIRFDTKTKNLEKEEKFIRIRSGFSNTLTFKRKIENKEFREREEIELEISDIEKMRQILKNLGFDKELIMEKHREKWKFKDAEIALDTLPMGTFVEIEGSEQSIKETAKLLGLDFENRILETYWEIWKDYTKKNRIQSEDITFEAIKK
ncbi:MAG: class IV adenylate cyclase [Candidatus Micrarchaeota archaeon]